MRYRFNFASLVAGSFCPSCNVLVQRAKQIAIEPGHDIHGHNSGTDLICHEHKVDIRLIGYRLQKLISL
jgi:hypothetical protein